MIDRTLHTRRLPLRPATVDDVAATWKFRKLGELAEWLTSHPQDIAGHRDRFAQPARLATTVVI